MYNMCVRIKNSQIPGPNSTESGFPVFNTGSPIVNPAIGY